MKPLLFFISLLFSITAFSLDHSAWNTLLSKNVSSSGKVNYKAFKANKSELDKYLNHLSSNAPTGSWSSNEKLAYWINAYNAFTVKLIIDNYPLKSITDLDKPWDKKFISIGGKEYSLNDIEHNILRKEFNDPRIHFGIVCASYSCPQLLNKAYTAKSVNALLDIQAKRFINDKTRNVISPTKAQLSEIFNWFKDDFTKQGSIIDYINKYSAISVNADADISYLKYSWALNE